MRAVSFGGNGNDLRQNAPHGATGIRGFYERPCPENRNGRCKCSHKYGYCPVFARGDAPRVSLLQFTEFYLRYNLVSLYLLFFAEALTLVVLEFVFACVTFWRELLKFMSGL